MAEFMADWDLLATPSTAVAAFPIGWDAPPTIADHQASPGDFARFSVLANLTGQPAISLPAGLTADGRPVGLQLLAPRLADAALLAAARDIRAREAISSASRPTAACKRSSRQSQVGD
jgi:aspartyl-tRNA(Asn)/glutamyl-tRNA(Gln) amidotransferase subunit A